MSEDRSDSLVDEGRLKTFVLISKQITQTHHCMSLLLFFVAVVDVLVQNVRVYSLKRMKY